MTPPAMTEEQFWTLIDATRAATLGHIADFGPALTGHLERLSLPEIEAFAAHVRDRLTEAYAWDLWGAAFVIGGGCSDDSFEYFRAWLVAQGRKIFERALTQPDDLADQPLDFDDGSAELELLLYVPDEVYRTRTGHDLPVPAGLTAGGEPRGTSWDEDDLDALFPKLTAKYG